MKEFIKAINKLAMKCVVKVLKVDLRTGRYKILYLTKGENKSNSPLLDDWVKESCDKQLIHPDYAEAAKKIISIKEIKKVLIYKKYIHFKFKRMANINCEYKTNVITILPCSKKCTKCIPDEVYLIVYDIDE